MLKIGLPERLTSRYIFPEITYKVPSKIAMIKAQKRNIFAKC